MSVGLARLVAYDHWANLEALASVRAASAPADRARQLVAHLVGAQWTWLKRLGEAGPEMAVWPELTLDECASHLERIHATWDALLSAATNERLAETVHYRNSKGEPWRSTVADIVTHVLLHSPHHRGQIAMELRRAGAQPAYTDFIHAVRQGHVADSSGG